MLRRSCADMMGKVDGAKAGARDGESEDERRMRHQAEAAGLFRSVVAEATGDQVTLFDLCCKDDADVGVPLPIPHTVETVGI